MTESKPHVVGTFFHEMRQVGQTWWTWSGQKDEGWALATPPDAPGSTNVELVNHDGIWWARNNNDWSPAAPPLAGKKPGETQMLLGRLWAYRGTDEGWVLASEIAKETSPVSTFAAAADMFTDNST